MDCELIDTKLVAFHFGEASPAVEDHLLQCRTCLREFLEIKRNEQTAEALGWEPPAVLLRWRKKVWIPAAVALTASLIWLGTWALHGTKPISERAPSGWAGAEPRSQSFF